MRLEEITERIASALTLMDASEHAHGVEESWRENRDPMGQVQPESAHLVFAVLCADALVSELDRNTRGREARCVSRVSVVFDYHIRIDRQVSDNRLAMKAAREVLTVLNDSDSWAPDGEDVVVIPRQRWSPTYLLDQEPYVRVTVSADIEHDEEI